MFREDSYCRNCGSKNTLLDGVCCFCSYNSEEDRPATEEEINQAARKMDEAIAKLKEFLQ